jgi:hypothetical protein
MNPLRRYLLEVRQAIKAWAGVRIEPYQEQRLTASRANLPPRSRRPRKRTWRPRERRDESLGLRHEVIVDLVAIGVIVGQGGIHCQVLK